MFSTRLITGIAVASVLVITVVLVPSFWFGAFILLIAAAAAYEWARLCGVTQPPRLTAFSLLVVLLALLLLNFRAHAVIINSLALVLWLFLAISLTRPKRRGMRQNACFGCALSVLCFTVFAVVELHMSSTGGKWWLLGSMCVVAAADAGAYYIGRAFGKRPLAKTISPKKTVEGLLGGIILVLVLASLAGMFIWPRQYGFIFSFAAVCGFVGMVSVIGDLYISSIKRGAQVKDSGQLLPGHGGMLDRIDSALVAVPAYSLCYKLLFS